MVVLLLYQFPQLPSPFSTSLPSPSPSSSKRSTIRTRISSSSSSPMNPQQTNGNGFMEFPYLSTTHRDLMVDLVSTMESRLRSQLLPSSLAPDVQYFENESGSAQGTLYITSGHQQSPVDFVLGSWIHSKLPSGGSLNITTLTAYLNTTTDAPHFLLEFIQSTPTSLILILDLSPRKDLVLHSNYLDTYYTETQLDTYQQNLYKLPEIKPYIASSLYIRSALSPTAVSVAVNCDLEGLGRMEEIMRDELGPAAKGMLEIWLSKCACGGRDLGEVEVVELEKRDLVVKKKTVELDLTSGLPRLFGDKVAGRVIEAIRKVFKV